MGQYRIEVVAVGGHGCQREKKDGSDIRYCSDPLCPDCDARRFIRQLQSTGQSIEKATFTHWPGTEDEVVDDLVSGIRKGSF